MSPVHWLALACTGLWVGIITAVLLDFCLRVGIGSPGVISIIGWRSWVKSCKGKELETSIVRFRIFVKSHPAAGWELKSSKNTSLSIKLHKRSKVRVLIALSLNRRSQMCFDVNKCAQSDLPSISEIQAAREAFKMDCSYQGRVIFRRTLRNSGFENENCLIDNWLMKWIFHCFICNW